MAGAVSRRAAGARVAVAAAEGGVPPSAGVSALGPHLFRRGRVCLAHRSRVVFLLSALSLRFAESLLYLLSLPRHYGGPPKCRSWKRDLARCIKEYAALPEAKDMNTAIAVLNW